MLVTPFYPYPAHKAEVGTSMLERTQMYMRPIKALGQHFLVNKAVAEVEAEHARGKKVIELGPGYGVLTRELCRKAKRVVAVELDKNLASVLKSKMRARNLRVINKDFFEATDDELSIRDTDIMISNVPYKLSSRVIEYLLDHRLQAVLCLQKEFVQHMAASPGTREYSKLSVMFQLGFSHTKLVNVSKGSFRPIPRVDSVVIYIKPKESPIGDIERRVINAMMQHKKKSVRNALADSSELIGMTAAEARDAAQDLKEKDSKVFKLSPDEILAVADRVGAKLKR